MLGQILPSQVALRISVAEEPTIVKMPPDQVERMVLNWFGTHLWHLMGLTMEQSR